MEDVTDAKNNNHCKPATKNRNKRTDNIDLFSIQQRHRSPIITIALRSIGYKISIPERWRTVKQYIEIWHNRKRMHSALNDATIEEFNYQINYKNIALMCSFHLHIQRIY